MKHPTKLFTILGLLLVLALAVTGCAAPAAPTAGGAQSAAGGGEAAAPAKESGFTIGVSNTLVGNGWREQMICAIKAEASASASRQTMRASSRKRRVIRRLLEPCDSELAGRTLSQRGRKLTRFDLPGTRKR